MDIERPTVTPPTPAKPDAIDQLRDQTIDPTLAVNAALIEGGS